MEYVYFVGGVVNISCTAVSTAGSVSTIPVSKRLCEGPLNIAKGTSKLPLSFDQKIVNLKKLPKSCCKSVNSRHQPVVNAFLNININISKSNNTENFLVIILTTINHQLRLQNSEGLSKWPGKDRTRVQWKMNSCINYTNKSVSLSLHMAPTVYSKNLTPRMMLKNTSLIGKINRWNNSFQNMYDML